MSASAGVHSYGSTIQVDTGGGTYVAIGEVISIEGLEEKVASARLTNLTSPSATHEKTPGLLDSGQVKFRLNMVHAQWNTLKGYKRLIKNWKVVFSDAAPTTAAFQGFLVSSAVSIPDDGPITGDIEIDITGPITWS